jgi:hypothetical protein
MFQGTAGIAFRVKGVIATGVLAMALNSITQAQSTATLEGIVTDATGAVVSGAAIQAHNTSTGEERTVVTDAAGAFVLPSLPLGSYRVSASSSGMQTMLLTMSFSR